MSKKTPTSDPDDPTPRLSKEERKEVRERTALRAVVVHEAIREEGEGELRRPASSLVWSGFAAGLSMGFSLVTMGLLQAHLPDEQWRPLIANFGYTVGFLIVVLGRQQLFTENTLTVILPLLAHRDLRTLFCVARLWTLVLLANLVGVLAFSWALGYTAVFDAETHRHFAAIARHVMEQDRFTMFVGAVFAGWLIAIMVWLLPSADNSRVGVVILMTYVVALGGFAHIIAGSAEVIYLVVTGGATWGEYLLDFMLPTLAGNIIGGVALVAMVNHAQVAREAKMDR
ncbi:MAG TPA: formate/nitrite transporter family protein [Pelomicrobium sp.]|nr:formate/nitrite transporter family protein [Pelomicrobium sp.]